MGKNTTEAAALFAQIGEPDNTAARRTAAAHALRQQPYAAVSDGLEALAAAPSARVRAAAALILGGLQTDGRDERQQAAALLCRLLRRGETPAVRAAAVAALAERCRIGTFGEEEFALIEPHLAPCFFADRLSGANGRACVCAQQNTGRSAYHLSVRARDGRHDSKTRPLHTARPRRRRHARFI